MKDLTRVVHHPEVSLAGYASLTVPTYRASTIVFASAADYANRKGRGPDGYTYGLQGTPTTKTLEAQLSALEGGAHTLIVPSGQAAITNIFMTVLRPGDTVMIPDNVYPPVKAFCRDFLVPRGIGFTVYDPMAGAAIETLIDARTKLIWMESPGSTTMEFCDIPAIVAVARAHGVLTGCDNTWATPMLFKPLEHGVDFSMEALTKYVGGHSDILLGSVSVTDAGRYAALKDTARLMGIGVSPDECALALRGIETLGVRLAHMGRAAQEMATFLAGRACVAQVLHPAFESCPGHAIWQRDFNGASGVFTVVLASECQARLDEALGALMLFAIGASWGGTRSLVAPMAIGHDRVHGGAEGLGTVLRISIGLEDEADLRADLARLCDVLEQAGG